MCHRLRSATRAVERDQLVVFVEEPQRQTEQNRAAIPQAAKPPSTLLGSNPAPEPHITSNDVGNVVVVEVATMADERTSEHYARATAAREDGTNLDDVRLVGNDDSEQQPHDHITSSPRRSDKGARFPPMCAAICAARALPSDNKYLAPITWHLCSKQNQAVGFFLTNIWVF